MTEERAKLLLSKIKRIKSNSAIVEAELMVVIAELNACLGSVGTAQNKQKKTRAEKKAVEIEKIRAQFHKK
ncbi:hypothetical protein [Chryseobacterium potabilaquae]|uniref:Uncharacterized protein n=1 Tax=Chryseobacterium potabilaquae TaxID=2675057 RepID=A0A6N4XCF5_9FLAO|nr:hypothetical protein [Chryseobacterium potabilaquae]CAA7196713.1 hypothetical protein CHRY9293_02788 [Chryseobacterium potabilaquae]